MQEEDLERLRKDMVLYQIQRRGIEDKKILEAFLNVPRHLFVPLEKRNLAYEDYPLPIGEGQTISQPYIVALMTKELEVKENEKVLEVGTGSGYQAAILSYLRAEVYSIERISSLAESAKTILTSLGYNVKIKIGDGTLGWKDFSPYDKIIVTAASPQVSPCWFEQLKIGGRIVLPLGGLFSQDLTVIDKINENETKKRVVCGCVFVPLVGKYGYKG